MAEIIRDLPIDQYHNDRTHTSHSRVRDFAERGPAYYEGRHITGEIAREETDAFRLGDAAEILIQQNAEALGRKYAIKPAHLDGRTKEGKAWTAANTNRPTLTEEEYQTLLAMAHTIRTEPLLAKARGLMGSCEQQVTLRGELHGCKVQARPDWICLREFAPYTIDLKTTKNLNDLLAALDECGPSLHRLGYHSQAALVHELLRQAGYEGSRALLLVVEKQPSYRGALLDITDLLPWGSKYLADHMPRLAECLRTDTWPRAPAAEVRVKLPRWVNLSEPEQEQRQPAA